MWLGSPWLAQVQLMVLPQPFWNVPHWFGNAAQVLAVHWQVPDAPTTLVLQVCPVPVQLQSMVPPQPSGMSLPHWPVVHFFGTQHAPETHTLPLAQEQSTVLQEFDTCWLHLPSHFGASQQALSLQIWPPLQLKVREPHALVTVPQ